MKKEKLKQISCKIFALFVIYLFAASPMAVEVEAQNGWDEKSAEDKFKEDPKKAGCPAPEPVKKRKRPAAKTDGGGAVTPPPVPVQADSPFGTRSPNK